MRPPILRSIALCAGIIMTPPVMAQQRTSADAAQIARMVDHAARTIAPGQPVIVQPLLGTATYAANLEYRQAPADAAIHEAEAEMFEVLAGSGTLITGGSLVNGHPVSAGNLSGSSIDGGTTRAVAAGDRFVIPAGTPHWFNHIDGRLVMIAMKVPVPTPLPAAPVPEPVGDPLVAGFRDVEAASAADAIEQLYGRRAYLPHDFRPVAAAKFAGRAVTVQLRREDHHEGTAASRGMIDAIDDAAAGSVYVMQVEDGLDVAGIGGLMATGMKARGFAGAIIDGGVRDVPQIEKIRFPVFSRSVAPSTTINHYRFAGANIPVRMGTVTVAPGDIIVADLDGVVVVPQAQAADVLRKAQELDFIELGTIPYIEKYRSIRDAVARSGRM